jgi:glycosyltransferase involved in cell wall biosynthesis
MVSFPETFGLSYLEAMATGNIVVGAEGGGIAGVIQSSHNGFLCTPGSGDDLSKLIESIITGHSVEDLEAILRNASETINRYTTAKAAENYLDRLYKILKTN